VAKSAWRDNSSFFLPDPESNALLVISTTGGRERIPYTLPQTLTVEGMIYFASTQTLIFYTETAVYTVNLARN
jgi:hypothetical protein